MFVGTQKVCKERSFGIVASVSLVNKEYSLQVCIVARRNIYWGLVFGKFLDIHHGDFQPAIGTFYQLRILDICHELCAVFYSLHNKSTSGKLIASLFHQVNSIHDEIELGRNRLLRKIVGEALYGVISQSRLAGALRMPNNSTLYAIIQFSTDGKRSEKLLVTHYMFFKRLNLFAVVFFDSLFYIGKAITKQEQETFLAQQRSQNAVRGSSHLAIRSILRMAFEGKTISVLKNQFFCIFRNFPIRILGTELFVFFAEHIEKRFLLANAGVERSLDRNTVRIVVFLIVAKNHQLGDVQKTPKTFVGQTLLVCAALLCNNAFRIIRLFHFDKSQWQTVHKARYIWAETITRLLILARKFRRHEPAIVLRIFEINQLDSRIRRKHLVKFTTKIVAAKLAQRKLRKNLKVVELLLRI